MAEPAPQQNPKTTDWRGWLGGALLTALVGMVLFLCRFGDSLGRLSYDLPFAIQDGTPSELMLVYIDGNVKQNLLQPTDQTLDRHFYTMLVNRLTDDGAKLILVDIIFDQANKDADVDEQFAAAIRRNGSVVLVADYIRELNGNVFTENVVPPIDILGKAAAGCGLAKLSPDKSDWAIRQLDTGTEDYPSVSWAAASLQPSVTKQPRLAPRWLNYYCWPGHFQQINFDVALSTNGVPRNFFRDKIIVVGSRPEVGLAGAGREEFPNPWTRLGRGYSTGSAVHALSLLNLLRGDWLVRMNSSVELAVVVIWGIFISLLLSRFPPWTALAVAFICSLVFALAAAGLQLRQHVWFAWAIPAAVQMPVALLWSVGYQYGVETRRRRKLRQAFGVYLSPYMADRIANSEFSLELGGREVEVSVMFTDLESFTKMSESLPPSEVSQILTTYFNQTTRAILEQDGTIIKYIGDAVMAVWGAPLGEPRHAQRAVLAAWGMSQAGKRDVAGRKLRTRIGVNTGMVLAGNLGSDFRFDYTLIGDTVNFASRLEGLNKYLGTDVLISEFTMRQLDERIKLRSLGRFIVVGKKNPVGIFEVLGPASDFPQNPPWLEAFDRAMEHFFKRELDIAEKLMREVMELRGGKDGPAEFYLHEIDHARERGPEAPWDGAVRFDSK